MNGRLCIPMPCLFFSDNNVFLAFVLSLCFLARWGNTTLTVMNVLLFTLVRLNIGGKTRGVNDTFACFIRC